MTDLDVALLAVAGTLLGAVVAGSLALVAGALSNSSARKLKVLELTHAAAEVNRGERRRVYAEFIDLEDRWRLLADDLALFYVQIDPPPKDDGEPTNLMFDGFEISSAHKLELERLKRAHDDLWEAWRRSLVNVKLLGSAEVAVLADHRFGTAQLVMDSVWAGATLAPDFDEDPPSSDEVVGVMRFDLGLQDGYQITETEGSRVAQLFD